MGGWGGLTGFKLMPGRQSTIMITIKSDMLKTEPHSSLTNTTLID